MSMPATVERVPAHTPPEVNRRIRDYTVAHVALYRDAPFHKIEGRIEQLDQEWTSERVLEVSAASFVVLGIILAAFRGKRWLLLPLVVGGFLIQHALQGWCPPLAIIRRMNFRTEQEVDAERATLIRMMTHPSEKEDPQALLQQAGWTT